MEDKRIYLLAQFDENANKALTDIYSKLAQAGFIGEQTKGIPYHFTLGSFESGCETEVLKRVQNVVNMSRAFDINLSYVGLFGLRVLFLAPSMNTELLALYKALVPGASVDGCHKWTAHATILIDNPENIQAAISIVAQSFVPFVAKIESVGVYEFFPKRLLAEYKLLI